MVLEVEFAGQYAAIPAHMQAAIKRYVIQGILPGDFLTGVITNNLLQAVNHADATNLPLLKLYVQWFYNEAPSCCWGSKKVMEEWLRERRKFFEMAPEAALLAAEALEEQNAEF